MRVCSLFFEDLPADLGRPPYQTGEVHGRLLMTLRIGWPLVRPGIAAGFALLFLTFAKELPVTLFLAPPGTRTLATRLWTEATDGKDLLRRVQQLPGFGKQKAQILVALLAKQLDVRPDGWEAAAGGYAEEGYRSVADVVALCRSRSTRRQSSIQVEARCRAKLRPIKTSQKAKMLWKNAPMKGTCWSTFRSTNARTKKPARRSMNAGSDGRERRRRREHQGGAVERFRCRAERGYAASRCVHGLRGPAAPESRTG